MVHQDDLGAVDNEAFRIHGELRRRSDIAGAGMNKSGAGTTAQAAAEFKSGTTRIYVRSTIEPALTPPPASPGTRSPGQWTCRNTLPSPEFPDHTGSPRS
ncbi:hypothetical protein ACFCZY_08760 [Streptomyces sp. NPDC056237]|uniref:hypothetical protein n=1 Tax=unclassified Streptomyces TaxID=2593676 RepID=UPI0035D641F8